MSVLSEELLQKIQAYFPRYPSKQAVTLPALHLVQDELRCVPLEAIREIADLLDLSPAEVNDTMTFYGFFRGEHNKLGRTRLWVCRGLACMLRGSDEVYGAVESPNGELGFYVVSDGSGVAYRARTRPPSYIHFAIFPYLIVGHQLSDIVAVLGSLNIIAAELDR